MGGAVIVAGATASLLGDWSTSIAGAATSSATVTKVAHEIGYNWSDVDLSGVKVKVGQLLALTGGSTYFGQVEGRGSALAVKHVREAGGPQLQLIAQDNQSGSPEAATAGARLLISEDNVPIIQTSFPAASLAIVPIIDSAKVLSFEIAGGTNSQLGAGKYFWMGGPLGTAPLPALAQYIRKTHPNAKKVALMVWNEKDSILAAPYFTKPWEAAGGTVVDTEIITIGSPDMSPELGRIKAKSPDVLFLILFGDDWATAIKQARSEGITVPIVGLQWDTTGQAITGDLDEGYVYASYAFDPNLKNPFMELYAPAFLSTYKTPPEIYDAFAYENTWFIADLVYRAVKAKTDPANSSALFEAFIKNPSTPASLLGKGYTWNKTTHEYVQPQEIYQIKNGQSESIGLVVDNKLRLGEKLSELPGN